MDEEIRERLDALERAVAGDAASEVTPGEAQTGDRLATVKDRVDSLEDTVAELEAATQALRGYVGNVRSVNREVERRADAALAKAESLETDLASRAEESHSGTSEQPFPSTREGQPPERSRKVAREGPRTGPKREKSSATPGATDGSEDAPSHCRNCGSPTEAGSDEEPWRAPAASPTSNGHQADRHGTPDDGDGPLGRLRALL